MAEQATLVVIKPDAVKRELMGATLSKLEPLHLEIIGAKAVAVSQELAAAIRSDHEALSQVRSLRAKLKATRERAGALANSVDALDKLLAQIEGTPAGPFGGGAAAGGGPDTLARLIGQLEQLYDLVQDVDAAPTTQALAAVADRQQALSKLLVSWGELKRRDVAALDGKLKQAGLPGVSP